MVCINYKGGDAVLYPYRTAHIKDDSVILEVIMDSNDAARDWVIIFEDLEKIITHRYDESKRQIVPIVKDPWMDLDFSHAVVKIGDFYYDFTCDTLRLGTEIVVR